MPKSLIDLWPSSANCLECLTTEAESASNAVFLAVHQPMRLTRTTFSATNSNTKDVKEKDLLEAFLSDDLPSGTLLLPIVGSSGVGKSHMIRWLDAHLRGRQDGVKRHVVRIPKSASLKSVLNLILCDLIETSGTYRKLHEELSSASMPKELDDATYGLLSKLIVALERNFRAARERIASGNERENDRKRMTHCSPQCLPSLLGDPTLKAHFAAYDKSGELGVLARIASRYINGSADVDGPQNMFREEDLEFGDDVNLSEVSGPVRIYLNVLKQQNGKNRSDAIYFLNEVVDQSLGELLDFGGSSLTDLFVRIREQLLVDDIELVLLVEDFAALAGIQFSLLDAIIREGIRDGKKVLCTMRTALAVTEGYSNLLSQETVMTRAQYVWHISDFPFSSESDAVKVYSNFVGGYLNASRWGKTEIETRHGGLSSIDKSDVWLPDYYQQIKEELSEDDVDLIQAFGTSDSGVSLFPFNKGVIRQLVQNYFKKGDKFEFNPRKLINRVLRDTLVDHRRAFDQGQFPPENFQEFNRNKLDLTVSSEISRRAVVDEKKRVEAFVYFWGDDPRGVAQAASLDPRLFSCFNLTAIDWSVAPPPFCKKCNCYHDGPCEVPLCPKCNKKHFGACGERPPPPPQSDWAQKIVNWRENKILKSGDASAIRGYLVEAIREHVDWNSLLIEKPTLDKTKIFLPNVTIGNPKVDDVLAYAARDEDLNVPELNDQFFAAINAVVRYHEHKSWDYDGAENDYCSYFNLIDCMSREAEVSLMKRSHGLSRSAVTLVCHSLLIGSRILNVDGASTNTDSDNIASIYKLNEPLSDTVSGKWGELCTSISHIRPALIDVLKKYTSARQGDGSKVLAVDASFLIGVIRETRKTWKLPDDLDTTLFRDLPQVREHVRTLKNTLDKSIEERGGFLSLWMDDVIEWLGEEFDSQQVQSEFLNTLTQANQQQVYNCKNYQYEQLRALVRSLSECKTKESVSLIRKISESSDFGQQLSAVSKVDDKTILTTRKVFDAYEEFLTQTTSKADERLATAPPSIDTISTKCLSAIETIDGFLNQLEGGEL
ncbi:protein DpdH [Coraliomargarita sp. SDUM461003]|uniref:Protein DpdH n=1 Tax=Thalassobacterium maritimum TaxID=3041265 RepID=A0ABU1AR76_9BACT|nr:protein DpdH [Coraliomargarita sp. SDUM461003]MDQ8206666.1 protein DpdH [Coraliomargarita sp. SDUM461003]